jgi:hypothetical protein
MSEWIPNEGVRLQVKQFEDGWGWSAWEAQVLGTWRPLGTPAPENPQASIQNTRTSRRVLRPVGAGDGGDSNRDWES